MPTDSQQPAADARRLVQTILQRLARVKNEDVGRAIGKDESTVSRIASGDAGIKLADLGAFLASLELKCVDHKQICVDREIYESYRVLARAAINDPTKLEWEPDQ